MSRRPVVAVVGGASASPALLAAAEALGAGLMERELRLVSGGRGGVMAAVSRGARQSPHWVEGRVLGILPGADGSDGNPWLDVALPTGLGHARNVLVVASADLVVALGGGAGTLSEIALAWQFGKPIAALDLGEGVSSRMAGQAVDERRSDRVFGAGSVAELLAWIDGRLRV